MSDLKTNKPTITTATGNRAFACSPVAVQAIIINQKEEILLLSSPTRNRDGGWQVISGGLEDGETALAGVLREVKEEAGPEIQVRPLGVVDIQTFHYDEKVRYMIGLYYLLAYEGGEVQPGDDMADSAYRWWPLTALADEQIRLAIPPDKKWVLNRAVQLYRLWKDDLTFPVSE